MLNQTINTVAMNDVVNVDILVVKGFVSLLVGIAGPFGTAGYLSDLVPTSGDPWGIDARQTKALV